MRLKLEVGNSVVYDKLDTKSTGKSERERYVPTIP